MYLHEFDRFVRHVLKPLAYLRYGDDFILVTTSCKRAYELRQEAIHYLQQTLKLSVNPKNDIVCKTQDGLKFLGHAVTHKVIVVDKHTTRGLLPKIGMHNIASYRSLSLARDVRARLDWMILDEIIDKSE